MHAAIKQLNPLSSLTLTQSEQTILKWIRSVNWEPVKDAHAPIPYKAKVPEFYGGVRLYNMQAGGSSSGSLGALELFIKKVQISGVIGKQELYPLAGHGNLRFLSLKKADLDNLGVGQEEEEDE
jgi:hypothetical protein